MEHVVLIATILGGITALWFLVDKLIVALNRSKNVFPECNEKFYEYYAEQIKKADNEIWLTSDGFNMRNPVSREYAELMKTATRFALEKGVTIHRFQMLDTMHLNWLHQLKALKEQYPQNFNVYYNRVLSSLPNVCVIDPSSKSPTSEKMCHRLGLFGQGSIAQSFEFFHGDKKLAKSTKEIIFEAINHPATKILQAEDIDELYKTLLNERITVVDAWSKANKDKDNGEDLSASGVFDEIAISEYMKKSTMN